MDILRLMVIRAGGAILPLFVMASLAGFVSAQWDSPPGLEPQRDRERPPARRESKPAQGQSYDVEVSLVVIDVVVTDREGKHIRGLKKEDFELYEDGKLQEITDFSEEGLPLTSQAQTARDVEAMKDPASEKVFDGRFFVLFFDESTMRPAELTRAREAARDFVRYEVFPKDRVAILRYGKSLQVLQDFTGDVDLLARALYTEGKSGSPATLDVPQTVGVRGPEDSESPAGDATESRNQSSVIRFQDSPDIVALQKYQANDRLYKALALAGKTLQRIKGRKTIVFFSHGFEAVFADHGLFKSYREMVNVLNSSNVAIYPIDAGGLGGKTPMNAESGIRPSPGDEVKTSPTDALRSVAGDQISSLKILAADTGGQALIGSNDLTSQIRKMAYSTSSYYLLGYSPQGRSRGAGFRDLKVKVKREGARALARKGYYQQDEFADLSKGRRKEQLEDALLSWIEIQDLPVQLRTEFYPRDIDRCLVAVEVGVGRGLLAADDKGGRVEAMLYLRREDGKEVERFREEIALASEDTLLDLRYVKSVEVAPGSYWLKVVVRDNVSGTLGTSGAYLTVPEFEEGRPTISSLVLMSSGEKAKLVTAKEGAPGAMEGFRVAGRQFYPSPENIFRSEGEVVCFFTVSNLKIDEKTQLPRMAVRYTIWRDGKPISQQTVHYKADEAPDPERGIPIHVRLPVGDLGAGSYRLEVSAYDVLAAKGMKSEVSFTVSGGA